MAIALTWSLLWSRPQGEERYATYIARGPCVWFGLAKALATRGHVG